MRDLGLKIGLLQTEISRMSAEEGSLNAQVRMGTDISPKVSF